MPPTPQEQLEFLEKKAEEAYDQMYDSSHPMTEYSDCKDYLRDAIGLARELGLAEKTQQLEERLAHIKAVYRSQFAG